MLTTVKVPLFSSFLCIYQLLPASHCECLDPAAVLPLPLNSQTLSVMEVEVSPFIIIITD